MTTTKRLEFLQKMTSSEKADSFTWYALALEYKSLGSVSDALGAFTELRRRDPDYVPMYLMCGMMLLEGNRREDAKEWLTTGLHAAKKKGHAHAAGEIEAALAGI